MIRANIAVFNGLFKNLTLALRHKIIGLFQLPLPATTSSSQKLDIVQEQVATELP